MTGNFLALTYFGCDTVRRYGLSVLKPCGYFFFASSSDTEVGMITSWPGFQLTGVATAYLAFNCSASSRSSTSSKLRRAALLVIQCSPQRLPTAIKQERLYLSNGFSRSLLLMSFHSFPHLK